MGFVLAAPWFGCVACVDGFGDLEQTPELPDPATPPLFVPVEAGMQPPGLAPTSTMPAPSSTVPTEQEPAAGTREPMGRAALTLLHGVVDAETVFFCIASEREGRLTVSDDPLPPGGLAFGERLVLSLRPTLETDFDATVDDLLPILLAAHPDEVAGKTCSALLRDFGYDFDAAVEDVEPRLDAQRRGAAAFQQSADAGASAGPFDASVPSGDASAEVAPDDGGSPVPLPPDAASPSPRDAGTLLDAGADAGFVFPELRAVELNRFPADSLEDRSYLLVASGCIGSPGLRDVREIILCGRQFESPRSSFTPIFIPLSRVTRFDGLGLQFVNASQAFPEATVRSNPRELEGTFFSVATNVLLGAIAPSFARRSVSVEDLGDPLSQVALDVVYSATNETLMVTSWGEALERSAVTLQDARAYTLVLVGPAPGVPGGPWWNAPAVVALENDPLRTDE